MAESKKKCVMCGKENAAKYVNDKTYNKGKK